MSGFPQNYIDPEAESWLNYHYRMQGEVTSMEKKLNAMSLGEDKSDDEEFVKMESMTSQPTSRNNSTSSQPQAKPTERTVVPRAAPRRPVSFEEPKSPTAGPPSSSTLPPNCRPPSYVQSYVPPIPFPIISGFLEKAKGDASMSLKDQSWLKRYVEVSEGSLRFFNSREEREDSGTVVPLAEAFVSVQAKRHIRLESRHAVRIFRATSEARAYHWIMVISRYSMVAPTAESWCMKLSGDKSKREQFEERYLCLSADGLISWYKSEKDDAECRGRIQVRGEGVSLNPDKRRQLWVQTKQRQYVFNFIDQHEAGLWFRSASWHSHRKRLENPAESTRN